MNVDETGRLCIILLTNGQTDKHHRAHLTERAFRAAGWVWTSSSTDSQHALLSPITPRLVKADELYVYIEPGGVRVGLEVVSRYFSLSATSLTATTHSSLLFNYLLLIRDEGVQAWVKRYKTPRNRAENLLLWKPSPHFISFFPLLLLFAPGTGKITTDPVYSLVQWWKICCH